MAILTRIAQPRKRLAQLSFLSILVTFSSSVLSQDRIISAGSSVTEIIEALDASSQLVAIDVTSEQPADKTLPVVGYHRQLAAEGLLALQPTLLIGSDEMGPDSTLNTLKQAGVKVAVINNENDVLGLDKRIDEIAQITGKQNQAQALKNKVQDQVSQLSMTKPETSKKVLFLLIHEGRPANVAGRNTTPDALIQLVGAINPAAQSLSSYKPISVESMIQMQPDVILVSGRSFDELGGPQAVIDKMPMLAQTPAGKNLNILTVDGKALVGGLGLKTLDEAQRLQPLIYPTKN